MNEQELMHYGVLGMKWGHRKASHFSSKTAKARKAAKAVGRTLLSDPVILTDGYEKRNKLPTGTKTDGYQKRNKLPTGTIIERPFEENDNKWTNKRVQLYTHQILSAVDKQSSSGKKANYDISKVNDFISKATKKLEKER